jgi:hypothetical protein
VEEDRLLLAKYRDFGPRWSILCKFFTNRSLNNIKNRWNSVVRKARASGLDENSEPDFLHCGSLITQHQMVNQRPDPQEPTEGLPDPEEFFQITNLLNHPATEILPAGMMWLTQ